MDISLSDVIGWSIAVIGLLITIVVGIWGGKTLYSRRRSQRMKTTNYSVSIQSGRDTKISKHE